VSVVQPTARREDARRRVLVVMGESLVAPKRNLSVPVAHKSTATA